MPTPAQTRRSRMEGWYWRLSDPRGNRVVVALCGVCRPRRGAPWAVVALATHPGGRVRWGLVDGAAGDEAGFGAWALPLLRGTDERLQVRVGGDSLDVVLRRPGRAPRPSLGPAHALPGLPQYWHAHLLGAEVEGSATVGGSTWPLDGALVYGEKNWGPEFAPDWWWGQASFDRDAVAAFAGGRVGLSRPTAVALRLGDGFHRFVAPFALVTATVASGAWRVRARTARLRVEIEGDAPPAAAAELPVPDVEGRSCHLRSRQHLAGRMHLLVREGRRTLFNGETQLAGLERGLPPGAPPG